MFYVYILYSPKEKLFYNGYTENLKSRLELHNKGLVTATKPYRPWKLVYYSAFEEMKLAKDFEKYLKTGSGKAFAYKRLLNSVALKKDRIHGSGVPKPLRRTPRGAATRLTLINQGSLVGFFLPPSHQPHKTLLNAHAH